MADPQVFPLRCISGRDFFYETLNENFTGRELVLFLFHTNRDLYYDVNFWTELAIKNGFINSESDFKEMMINFKTTLNNASSSNTSPSAIYLILEAHNTLQPNGEILVGKARQLFLEGKYDDILIATDKIKQQEKNPTSLFIWYIIGFSESSKNINYVLKDLLRDVFGDEKSGNIDDFLDFTIYHPSLTDIPIDDFSRYSTHLVNMGPFFTQRLSDDLSDVGNKFKITIHRWFDNGIFYRLDGDFPERNFKDANIFIQIDEKLQKKNWNLLIVLTSTKRYVEFAEYFSAQFTYPEKVDFLLLTIGEGNLLLFSLLVKDIDLNTHITAFYKVAILAGNLPSLQYLTQYINDYVGMLEYFHEVQNTVSDILNFLLEKVNLARN